MLAHYQQETAYVLKNNGSFSPAKGVVSVMAARVQIPASPLKPRRFNVCGVSHPVVSILQIVISGEKCLSTTDITTDMVVIFLRFLLPT